MVATMFAFLGSLFNLFIDLIYKITLTLVVVFLIGIALSFGFAMLIINLVT